MMIRILVSSAFVIVLLLVILGRSIALRNTRAARIKALVVMGLLPGLWLLAAVCYDLKYMTTVDFCTQCHTMTEWGKSLHVEDDGESLVALHYQNNYIDKDTICYECHAHHEPIIGPIKTKLNGLIEAYIEYFGTPRSPLVMSKPYENKNCLMCHAEAENFRKTHEEDLADILAGETSCLECHDVAHKINGE